MSFPVIFQKQLLHFILKLSLQLQRTLPPTAAMLSSLTPSAQPQQNLTLVLCWTPNPLMGSAERDQ